MNMETLEFIIYPDGRVKEMVTGIVGSSCEEVTTAIESALGQVLSQETTSDYYAQKATQSLQADNPSALSEW
jgi:hypothetical protein